jgi:hypothetical protein
MKAFIVRVSLVGAALFGGMIVSDVVTPIEAHAVCTAYCTPGKSYACGGGCISIYKLCRKPTTTACNGTRPPEASKHYTNPEKVEPKDYSKESKDGAALKRELKKFYSALDQSEAG